MTSDEKLKNYEETNAALATEVKAMVAAKNQLDEKDEAQRESRRHHEEATNRVEELKTTAGWMLEGLT